MMPSLRLVHRLPTFAWLAACLLTAVAQAQSPANSPAKTSKTLGIYLYERFELLDVCGPAEIFGNLRGQVKIIMLSQQAGPVSSTQGPSMLATHSLADSPQLDWILVPGGIGTLNEINNRQLLEWLNQQVQTAELIMSVCSGSGILAKAGLLDNRPATTNKLSYQLITSWRPEVDWQPDARWVDAGNIVTSSGVSAGIDMSLAVVSRFYGRETALKIAQATEYVWNDDPTKDPFAVLAKP
ncbi:MAG: DJ-1/PfpI family protein [Pirellulaceae bacterium]|nr:DJ-1/PfpI family protein [Pirellulaceae bacterium]